MDHATVKLPHIERGYPLIGALPSAIRGPLAFFEKLARCRPGEIVGFRAGPVTVYLVTHPNHVQEMLVDNWRSFGKGAMWKPTRPFLGTGLLASEGELWQRQRRLMQPLFGAKHLASLVEAMVSAIDREVERLARHEPGKVVDLEREMHWMTQHVALHTMFGSNLSPAEIRNLTDDMVYIATAIAPRVLLYFLPAGLPLPGDRELRRRIDRLDAAVLGLLRMRRASGEKRDDLLSLLLSARDDETSQGMDDRQLRDELVNLFFAGSDTTTNTLTWLFYLLDRHPEVDRRLRAEVREVIGDRRPTHDDLARLTYTRQVIYETLRLYPGAYWIPRTVEKDAILGGYRIPAGSGLLLCPWVTHRDPTFWPEPERFDPDRFTAERSAGRPRHAYYPFGTGPRQCIGNNFSIMETQLVAARMVQRFAPRLAPGHRPRPRAAGTLKVQGGMKMTLGSAP